MSLDQLFAQLAELPEQLRALREDVARLEAKLENASAPMPTYDAQQLVDMGYSKHQAYQILNARGAKAGGRLRITASALAEYVSEAEA